MTEIELICSKAKNASLELAQYDTAKKNELLLSIADNLLLHTNEILDANKQDLDNSQNLPAYYLDRMRLDSGRISAMANGIKAIAALSDPIGEIMEKWITPVSNLLISKVRVPLGVIGIIYESRPNVTTDTASLCLKSGNAVVLRGSREVINSNLVLINIMKSAILKKGGNPDIIGNIICSHEEAKAFMRLNQYIDVLVPRGSNKLIQSVVQNSTIPVIETGTGNCHIYIESSADIETATEIVLNAKTSRPSVCNAAESMLIDESLYKQHLGEICQKLADNGVEIRGCSKTLEVFSKAKIATDEDYYTEFLDYIISVKVVKDYKEAIDHINHYGTGHSDSIITQNNKIAKIFTEQVNSAAVYVNASTRFTDGGEFGFGAEMGISTQKLHARGPVGLKELTSYKYIIQGNGQIRK